MFKNLQEAMKSIQEKRRELERRVKETCIIVVLLGAGSKGLERRRNIDKKLEKKEYSVWYLRMTLLLMLHQV